MKKLSGKKNGKRDRQAAKKRLSVLCALAGIWILFSILAPLLAHHDPYATQAGMIRIPPCAEYPFGTDSYGRCVFCRVLYGARTSIFSSLVLVLVSFLIGTALGILCGWLGGPADTVIMRIADIFLAFPQMVLAIAVAGILGGNLANAMLAMGITGWTVYARMARSAVLSLKNEPFIAASEFAGEPARRIIVHHLIPNIIGPLAVYGSTQVGTMMIGIAGLSFLGVGVTPPEAEWGSMINEARAYLQLAPWTVLFPALAILLTVILFNALGDAVRDYAEGGFHG